MECRTLASETCSRTCSEDCGRSCLGTSSITFIKAKLNEVPEQDALSVTLGEVSTKALCSCASACTGCSSFVAKCPGIELECIGCSLDSS